MPVNMSSYVRVCIRHFLFVSQVILDAVTYAEGSALAQLAKIEPYPLQW